MHGVSCIPTQRCSLEEDDGEGCVTVQQSPGIEALCSGRGGKRLARRGALLSATAFKEFSLSVAVP